MLCTMGSALLHGCLGPLVATSCGLSRCWLLLAPGVEKHGRVVRLGRVLLLLLVVLLLLKMVLLLEQCALFKDILIKLHGLREELCCVRVRTVLLARLHLLLFLIGAATIPGGG